MSDEPADPDWQEAPPEIRALAAHAGRTVYLLDDEGVCSGTLFVSPAPWADARRREGPDEPAR